MEQDDQSNRDHAAVIEMIRLLARCMDTLATRLRVSDQNAIQQAAQQMYTTPRAYFEGQNAAARQYTYNQLRGQLEALLRAAGESHQPK